MKTLVLPFALSLLLCPVSGAYAQGGPVMNSFEYGPDGELKAHTDPMGHREQVTRDAAGRIIKIEVGAAATNGGLLAAADTGAATATETAPPAPFAARATAEGRVMFSIHAPQAKAVVVRGQWSKDSVPMVRAEGDKGDWSVVVDKIPAGVWEYGFEVDGLTVTDPNNPAIKPQRQPGKSILSIPSTPPAPWDWQNVPHGTVHAHGYLSKALGKPREMAVYTPPGYENSGDKKYPLLVLQHGSGDNQKTWVDHGKVNWILDNLIAQGKCVPMIVLMIDGHPLGMINKENPEPKPGAALAAFERELFDDALPLTESLYRVEKGPASRAFAGLSMGGEQALGVALAHLETFGWIGAFSAQIPKGERFDKLMASAVANTPPAKLLWIESGKDDPGKRQQNEDFVAQLKEKGVKFHWELTEGDHSWPIWRGYLVDFAPLLFRDAGK